jgi:hypothetical protein
MLLTGFLVACLGAPLVIYQALQGTERRARGSWRLGWVFVVLGSLLMLGGLF